MGDESVTFFTGNNYLKRSTVLKKDETVSNGGFVSGSVTHSLGYVPAARVYYIMGGKLIESYGNVSISANIPAFNGVYVNHKIKSNTVQYSINNNSGSSKTVTIIVIIYLDDVA